MIAKFIFYVQSFCAKISTKIKFMIRRVTMSDTNFCRITPEIETLASLSAANSKINPDLYGKYDVKRGLRDNNGRGVLTGLTNISDVRANKVVDGEFITVPGELYFRGYNVKDLIKNISGEGRFCFEEVAYLMLFGKLPSEDDLEVFLEELHYYQTLPTYFVRDIIMKAPSPDIMNSLARSVLTLYSYDDKADDISLTNVLRQCIQLIAQFPLLSVYSYQVSRHYFNDKSLYIHRPKPELSVAENILRILRSTKSYTPLEAKILDIALVLHMEHGGGNNSTFTTHVVTSSGTDTYSSVAASLGSLKGPRHGGANIKVVNMFEDMERTIHDWTDETEVAEYLRQLLRHNAFDKQGLIYGMGHAIYSYSDPREEVLRTYVKQLAEEKGFEKEFELYSLVQKLGPEIIAEERKIYKGVCCNVDFYSGLLYKILNIPKELYTPLFAIARIVGWSAHRMEELSNNGKIIRPAYKPIKSDEIYVPMSQR